MTIDTEKLTSDDSLMVVRTLALIADYGPMTLTALAGHLDISSAGMTGIADKTDTAMLTAREPVKGDRRKHLLRLTSVGRSFLENLKPEAA